MYVKPKMEIYLNFIFDQSVLYEIALILVAHKPGWLKEVETQEFSQCAENAAKISSLNAYRI